MIRWALFFFLISLVSGALGFTGVASASAGIAKFLCFVFLGLCVLFLIVALVIGERIRDFFRGSRL